MATLVAMQMVLWVWAFGEDLLLGLWAGVVMVPVLIWATFIQLRLRKWSVSRLSYGGGVLAWEDAGRGGSVCHRDVRDVSVHRLLVVPAVSISVRPPGKLLRRRQLILMPGVSGRDLRTFLSAHFPVELSVDRSAGN